MPSRPKAPKVLNELLISSEEVQAQQSLTMLSNVQPSALKGVYYSRTIPTILKQELLKNLRGSHGIWNRKEMCPIGQLESRYQQLLLEMHLAMPGN